MGDKCLPCPQIYGPCHAVAAYEDDDTAAWLLPHLLEGFLGHEHRVVIQFYHKIFDCHNATCSVSNWLSGILASRQATLNKWESKIAHCIGKIDFTLRQASCDRWFNCKTIMWNDSWMNKRLCLFTALGLGRWRIEMRGLGRLLLTQIPHEIREEMGQRHLFKPAWE